jgi:endonuclease I
MKKLAVWMLVVISLVTIASCKKNPTLNDVVDEMNIVYAPGDSQSSVSTHIQLSKTSSLIEGVTIEWQSSHPGIIDTFGTVNLPDLTTEVTLTVKVTLDGLSSSTQFVLTVVGRYQAVTVQFKVLDDVYQTYTIVSGGKIAAFANPELEGYAFEGWYIAPAMTIPFSFNDAITEDLVVQAKLRAVQTGTYTVNTYVQNISDENYTLETTTVHIVERGTVIDLTTTRVGFLLNTEQSITTGTVSEIPLVLNVYYDRQNYTVIFMSDGIEIDRDVIVYGEYVVLPEEITKEGATFAYWSTTTNGQTAFDETVLITSNTTLYAIWQSEQTYTGYYQSISNVTDGQLLMSLRQLITTMNLKTYGEARYLLDDTDRDPSKPANVILVYNRASVSGEWDGGITWNREHVWPQSYLGASAENSLANIASDLQNLKPANPSINSSRGNNAFVSGSGVYKLGGGGFYPGDADRGDIARILLYMHVRWGLTINTSTVGDLNLLLRWHKQDPVDNFERNRNELIYTYQGNRNPFIDYPDFAERIWGPIVVTSTNQTQTIHIDFESIMTEIIVTYEIHYTEFKKTTYIM